MTEGPPEAGVETPAVDLNEWSSAAKTQGHVFWTILDTMGSSAMVIVLSS